MAHRPGQVELVYSPIADIKEYPEGVDVALVEGAIANEENLKMIRTIRARTKVLISFGDCAVTGNVTALRNPLGVALEVLQPVYRDRPDINPEIPDEKEIVPVLLDQVQPVHAVVPVDFYLPGCPPPADRIRAILEEVLLGQALQLTAQQRRFG